MPIIKRNELGQQMLLYETPENFEIAVKQYLDYLYNQKTEVQHATGTVSRPIYPTVEGLANYLDIDPDTISNYAKRPGYDEVVRKFKGISKHELIQQSLSGGYQPAVAIFLMKNYHDMRDSFDINANQYQPERIDAEEIKRLLNEQRKQAMTLVE